MALALPILAVISRIHLVLSGVVSARRRGAHPGLTLIVGLCRGGVPE